MRFQEARLGEHCTKLGSGFTPHGGEQSYVDDGVPFIRSQNVLDGDFTTNGLARVGSEDADALEGASVCEGDILLNITGDSVARSCLAPSALLPARVSQHVMIVRTSASAIDPRYLSFVLRSERVKRAMLSLAGSGGTRKALTKEMVGNLRIPLPPIAIQLRISEVLGRYDDLIANNQRRITLLEEAARQLYREWFVRLRFPGAEHTAIADGVPEGWSKRPLGELVDNFDRMRIPLSVFEREKRCGAFPYYGAAGVIDYVDEYLFDGRYLLVGEDGTVQTSDGFPMLQLVEGKFWVSNHAHVLKGREVTTEYLFHVLATYRIAGHVTGVAQPKLTQASLNRIPILVSTESLRAVFQEHVEPMIRQRFLLTRQNTKLRVARDLLLPRLMSGELTP